MNISKETLADRIKAFKQLDSVQQHDTACNMARAGDPDTFPILLDILANPDEYDSGLNYAVAYALGDSAHITVTPLLAHLELSPFSKEGIQCAYVLGEVAYRQGEARDNRIVPTLLKIGNLALSKRDPTLLCGVSILTSIIGSLRECVRVGSVSEVSGLMQATLLLFREAGEELSAFSLLQALEVLYVNDRDDLLKRLTALLETLPPIGKLTETIEEFLIGKETGEENW